MFDGVDVRGCRLKDFVFGSGFESIFGECCMDVCNGRRVGWCGRESFEDVVVVVDGYSLFVTRPIGAVVEVVAGVVGVQCGRGELCSAHVKVFL